MVLFLPVRYFLCANCPSSMDNGLKGEEQELSGKRRKKIHIMKDIREREREKREREREEEERERERETCHRNRKEGHRVRRMEKKHKRETDTTFSSLCVTSDVFPSFPRRTVVVLELFYTHSVAEHSLKQSTAFLFIIPLL